MSRKSLQSVITQNVSWHSFLQIRIFKTLSCANLFIPCFDNFYAVLEAFNIKAVNRVLREIIQKSTPVRNGCGKRNIRQLDELRQKVNNSYCIKMLRINMSFCMDLWFIFLYEVLSSFNEVLINVFLSCWNVFFVLFESAKIKLANDCFVTN